MVERGAAASAVLGQAKGKGSQAREEGLSREQSPSAIRETLEGHLRIANYIGRAGHQSDSPSEEVVGKLLITVSS